MLKTPLQFREEKMILFSEKMQIEANYKGINVDTNSNEQRKRMSYLYFKKSSEFWCHLQQTEKND
jgi:hypothetical protein